MSTVRFQIAVSLDGYAAGPDQSKDTRSASAAWICTDGSSSSRRGASNSGRRGAR
jgi:hypothetical protein